MSKVKTQLVIEGENKAGRAFREADSQLTRLSKNAKAAGAFLTAAFTVGAGAAELARRSAEAVVQMERMAQVSGTTVEVFQRWQFAARALGMESDKIGDVFKDVQDKVGDFLQSGGGPMKDFFEQIAPLAGVTAEQFRELSGPDALQLYVSSLEKANLSQSEMTFYMEAIANDATLLLPLLRNNGEEFQRLAKRAEEFGFIVGGQTAADAKEFAQNMDTLGLVGESVGKRLTAEMLPAMNEMTGLLLDYSKNTSTASTASDILSFGLKTVATAVIIAGNGFATLGRLIGATAAAASAVGRGEFSQAATIMRTVVEDNVKSAGEAMEQVRKLWDGSYQREGEGANRTAQELKALSRDTANDVGRSNEALAESYKQLTADAKTALRELVSQEKSAQKDIEDIREKRIAIEQRYADAISGFNGKPGASYGNAQDLKIAARQALQAGDVEGAQKAAQAALKMLEDLAQAGENTYGFEGFAKELQQIELAANDIEQSRAEQKLADIKAQVESLNNQITELTKFDLEIAMPESAKQELIAQMQALADRLGKELTIQPTVLAPAVASGDALPGYASGGRIRGPGTGTSDSVLMWGSNGEYVIRAAAVRKYGQSFLDSINGMNLPRYADGGMVGAAPATAGGTPLYLTLGDRTFGLQGDSSTIEDLARFARTARLKRR